MYRLMRNKVGGTRYIQGAWGMGNKHGWRTDDLVGAGDTGRVAETRYMVGHGEHTVGPVWMEDTK